MLQRNLIHNYAIETYSIAINYIGCKPLHTKILQGYAINS